MLVIFQKYPTGMTDNIHGNHSGTYTNTYMDSTLGPSGGGYGPGVWKL